LSDQNHTPPGEGYPPSGSQPPGGGNYPPPAPTSGGAYPPPTSGGGFPPPGSGGGFQPPTSGGPVPPSGGPFPPQGGNPQGAFPPPGGQPPTGGFPPPGGFQPGYDPNAQQQGGFQPGYDPNAQQFGGAPGGPVAPSGGRGNKWKIAIAVVGVLLLLCCVGGFFVIRSLGGDSLADAKQGDCLKGKIADGSSDQFKEADLEPVKCSDSAATYVIEGRVTGKTQAQAQTDDQVCAAFKDADTVFWFGTDGAKGTVLCLKEQ
jgi:hypothetical protein